MRTVKQCPPFVDAMGLGFVIPLPCDVTISDGALAWDWNLPAPAARMHPRAPISFHSPAQLAGTPLAAGDQVAIKFNCFWTIELPPGWSLLATHPFNRPDLPFRTLTGLVDADRFHDVGLLFPAVWTDLAFQGVLARGTPVAQCVAVPRTTPDLAFDDIEPARYDALGVRLLSGPGVYRRDFRADRSAATRDEGAAEVLRAEP